MPGLVEALLEQWECRPDGAATHGQVGLVLPVRDAEGAAAVLKVSFPHPGNVHEPDAYTAWGGRGAVRLHRRDDARFAMLLERADPRTLADHPDLDEAVALAGRLTRTLAVAAPPGLPRLSEQAGPWAEELRRDADRLPRPLPRRVVDAAVATVRELGPEQPDTLVHGDLHFGNVLRAEREPWLAIDPKGRAGDPAYDGFTLLRSRVEELLAADDPHRAVLRRLAIYAEAAELDPERVRRWAQARAVSAAHWGREHGDPHWLVELADRTAELLSRSPAGPAAD
ncbi:aminoglycoside/hydroxyurea antibiotic resistance kinase [Kitasatospora cheerisanensis KCTC 2395]|uniref:Aminoglycoside/hydroxyurea antibiotic resistance kinase n=1 Tax=Kitasatospora cheerisanensis KCTC 2395 TaxID=1348663 RepID=A0A066ZAD9_9ACTN|nr:aminoglycoside/hydroxyurea antibiotic resistance kinase [Kitasatospora cheerisanensis KCTC 2395]